MLLSHCVAFVNLLANALLHGARRRPKNWRSTAAQQLRTSPAVYATGLCCNLCLIFCIRRIFSSLRGNKADMCACICVDKYVCLCCIWFCFEFYLFNIFLGHVLAVVAAPFIAQCQWKYKNKTNNKCIDFSSSVILPHLFMSFCGIEKLLVLLAGVRYCSLDYYNKTVIV